jgi:hypothetical protein
VRTLLLCPHCGSDRVYYEAGMITGEVYHCYECDYVGSLIIEREVDEEQLKEEPEEEQKEKKKGKRKWFRRT